MIETFVKIQRSVIDEFLKSSTATFSVIFNYLLGKNMRDISVQFTSNITGMYGAKLNLTEDTSS